MKLTKLIKSVMKLSVFVLLMVSASAQASPQIPYYGDDFYQSLQAGVSDLQLKMELSRIFEGIHIAREGQNDVISDICHSKEGSCYRHNVVGYKVARNFITRDYYLRQLASGAYVVNDLYCDTARPSSANGGGGVNVEHTWPQSRFNRGFPKDMQKSDLHHLYPTDINVNLVRGNHIFGEVDTEMEHLNCQASRFGLGSAGAQEVFEPPQNHKGNVARALFYFSVRYDLTIGKDEEKILRQWHNEDPVNEEEMERNNRIFELQHNRNPFIDFPELVERITDF